MWLLENWNGRLNYRSMSHIWKILCYVMHIAVSSILSRPIDHEGMLDLVVIITYSLPQRQNDEECMAYNYLIAFVAFIDVFRFCSHYIACVCVIQFDVSHIPGHLICMFRYPSFIWAMNFNYSIMDERLPMLAVRFPLSKNFSAFAGTTLSMRGREWANGGKYCFTPKNAHRKRDINHIGAVSSNEMRHLLWYR